MARTYADAIETLNSLQTNFSIIEEIRKSRHALNAQAVPRMRHYLHRAGYEASDLDSLNAIHIAGTKGKGSTSALVASILSHYTTPTASRPNPPIKKVGLYTSPHLRFVRERIQIDGAPLPEPTFAKYFFEVYDRLSAPYSPDPALPPPSRRPMGDYPAYFSFLTLLAFHAFLAEGVDAAVVECGIGGAYDSTNVLLRPSATGVTSLGIDHTGMLGETLDSIAWHKAGIFKAGVPAFTVPQLTEALLVLKQRAREAGTTLTGIPRHPEIDALPLSLQGDFQKSNASLAAALAAAYLRSRGLVLPCSIPFPYSLPREFRVGLQEAKWPGRCDARADPLIPSLTWNLDCGHTRESVAVAGSWFRTRCADANLNSTLETPHATQPPRILLFNQQTRQAHPLLSSLLESVRGLDSSSRNDDRGESAQPFSHVIFSSNRTFREEGFRPDLANRNVEAGAVEDLRVQREMAGVWRELVGEEGGGVVEVVGSLEEAVGVCRGIAKEWGGGGGEGAKEKGGEVMVLVVGSVHLVGGVMEVLETEAEREREREKERGVGGEV